MSVCFKFSQLCFCQIFFELVYSWKSYHKNNRVNFLLRHSVVRYKTLCIAENTALLAAVIAQNSLSAHIRNISTHDRFCFVVLVRMYFTLLVSYRILPAELHLSSILVNSYTEKMTIMNQVFHHLPRTLGIEARCTLDTWSSSLPISQPDEFGHCTDGAQVDWLVDVTNGSVSLGIGSPSAHTHTHTHTYTQYSSQSWKKINTLHKNP